VSDQAPLPFATATIARLYMAQGKLTQAEALYQQLLRDSPDDPRLTAGLAEVQRRLHSGGAPVSADQVALAAAGDRLTCTWNITEEALGRARALSPDPARLVLRLMVFPLGPEQKPADTALEALQGSLELDPPPGTALIAAAVGLLGEERFHSIAHCTFSPGS